MGRQFKGTTKESETRTNNLDVAMRFYIRAMEDASPAARREYMRTAREILEYCSRHPRHDEYMALLDDMARKGSC